MENVLKLKKSQSDLRGNRIFNYVFVLEVILFFIMAFFFVPEIDDLAFRYYQHFSNIKEFLHCIFYYGNGRLLGNAFLLLFSCNTITFEVFNMLEAVLVVFLSAGIEKLTGLKNAKVLVMAVFMLQNVTAFTDSISWMAAFINYYFPIALFLLTLLILKKPDAKFNVFYLILLGVIGLCEQLFVEHNTVINILVSAALFLYALLKDKKGLASGVILFASNCIGAAIMFLYKIYIDFDKTYIGTTFPSDYRKTIFSQPDLKSVFYMISTNLNYICLSVATSAVIFFVLFYVMIHIVKQGGFSKRLKVGLYINCAMYAALFALSTYLLTFYGNDFPDDKLIVMLVAMNILLFAATFVCFAVLFYIIILKKADKTYAIKIASCAVLGILSVCPFVIVSPCAYRCCQYILFFFILAMLLTVKYASEKYEFRYNHICSFCAVLTVGAMIMYTAVFVKEKKVYFYQEKYYSESVYLPASNDVFIAPSRVWDKISGFEHEYIPLEEFEKMLESKTL